MPRTLPMHRLVALNTATASENKIHDDAVAARLGFAGGLVPGVDVYGYLCQPALAHWGLDLLRGSTVTTRFATPVLDGEPVEVTAAIDDDEHLRAEVTTPAGTPATLEAHLVDPSSVTVPTTTAAPQPASRPAASPQTLAEGTTLGSVHASCSRAEQERHLADIRDPGSCVGELGVAHPAWLLRLANHLISETVLLGPWMHVGSTTIHLAPVAIDEAIVVEGHVTRHYEHKGHRFVVAEMVYLGPDRSAPPDHRAHPPSTSPVRSAPTSTAAGPAPPDDGRKTGPPSPVVGSRSSRIHFP